jgi:hypothetical protein
VTPVNLGGGTLELLEDLDDTDGESADIRASNRSAYNNKAYTSVNELPAGIYTFIVKAMNKGRGSSVKVGDTTAFTIENVNASKGAWTDKTFTNVAIPAAGNVTLVKGGGNTIDCYDIIIAIRTGVNITPANNWSTYVTPYALDFSNVAGGLKAYVATAAASGVVTLDEVGAVPAGTPLMLVGTASTEYTVPVIAPVSAPAVNMFRAGDGTTVFNGSTFDYILYTDGKFYQIGSGSVPVGKAYLHCDSNPTTPLARELRISFGDNITGIEQIDNGQLTIDNSQDGKFIENGKLVIVKNGVKYNAAGAQVK